MLDILINDYNTANGENSFHKTPLRWQELYNRRIHLKHIKNVLIK